MRHRLLRSLPLAPAASAALLAPTALPAVGAERAAAQPTVFFTMGTPGKWSTAQLWAVGADGSNPRLLRRNLPRGPEGPMAVLSRKGNRILCICRRGEIDSIRLDGSGLRRLGRRPRGSGFTEVTLGPTGRVFWVRKNRLLSQRPDGGDRQVHLRVDPRRVVIDRLLAVSPSGRRIAYVTDCFRAGCRRALRTMRLDGSERTVAYREQPGYGIASIVWSHDETMLAFSHALPGELKGPPTERQWDSFVVGRDGSGLRAIAAGPAAEENPFFSPDDSRLLYTHTPPAPDGGVSQLSRQLLTIGLDGGAPLPLLDTGCVSPACLAEPRVFAWTAG